MNGADSFDDELALYSGDDNDFDVDPDSLRLVYDSGGNVTGVTGFDDDLPLRDVTPFADGWYAAFLSNDPADGAATIVDTNQLVMITAVGAHEDRSMEVIQAIIKKEDVLFSMPPATITLLGPTPDFWGGSSDVHEYGGDDCGGAGLPGLYVPVVGTIGTSAEAAAEEGIKYDPLTDEGPDYESGPYVREDTFADLTDPTEPTVISSGYGEIDPAWTDCVALREMVEEKLRPAADAVCCKPPVCTVEGPCDLPPTSISNTVFIDGDYVVGPEGGEGTLVVTGELRYDGKASWRGMIFVIGEGVFIRHGAGNGSISGSILVADIAGPDEIYGTGDDCTGGENGFDSVHYDVSGGGNASTVYCTADIIAAEPKLPYRIVSFLQH
jgi:hypothetical protein